MVAELVARVRSILRGVIRTRRVHDDLKEEFRLHIELRTADLVKAGMTPAEAARKARADFGSMDYHVESARNARGLRWFDAMRFSWLDLKLGGRMLLKYPVLTLVGGFSMAFAIWVGAGTFEAIRQLVFPAIPLPSADQIVVLQNWDASANDVEARATHDFLSWRGSLQSVQDLSAYRTVTRNLMITEGLAEPVLAAELSAAAFRVLRVPPVLGRTLVESDEQVDAPLVAVIGHDLWQSRFKGDSSVIGRTVRLTGAPSTIVGVMPAGFAFPRTQELWVPLKLSVADRRAGMELEIFGRLTRGASLTQARTELENVGQIAAVDFPDTHQHLRPQLFTFAQSVRAIGGAGESKMLLTGNLFVLMLIVLVCANVGLLMFARASTRETEIVIRSALGASRQRIVMQMFAEALVLGTVAAIVGLVAAEWGVRWGLSLMRGELTDGSGNFPFWVTGKLSPITFVYTALLTLLAAAIAGIVPGLRITRNLGEGLKRTTAGAGGTHFGGLWTAVIVLQLAVTMGFPVVTFILSGGNVRPETEDNRLPIPVDQYLSVRLDMERDAIEADADTSAAAFKARFVTALQKLETRLASEPGVEGVVFAQHLPGQYHPNYRIEVDAGAVAEYDERGHLIGSSQVDPRYLDAFGVSMLSGRWFNPSEAHPDARVAVVNKAFVDRIMGGKNPIGQRIRYVTLSNPEAQPWYEIIGVAPNLGIQSGWGAAGMYRPLVREALYPLNAAIRVRGDPNVFAPRVRAIATDIDVTLRLTELMPLKDVANGERDFQLFWVRMTTFVSAMLLVFSLVSIYAVMSFAVSRRTREIGVRVALGATPRRIVKAVFKQPLRQLGMGLLAGTVLVWVLLGGTDNGVPTVKELLTLGGYTTLVAVVFLIACLVPTRRALAVQPTEALRES